MAPAPTVTVTHTVTLSDRVHALFLRVLHLVERAPSFTPAQILAAVTQGVGMLIALVPNESGSTTLAIAIGVTVWNAALVGADAVHSHGRHFAVGNLAAALGGALQIASSTGHPNAVAAAEQAAADVATVASEVAAAPKPAPKKVAAVVPAPKGAAKPKAAAKATGGKSGS